MRSLKRKGCLDPCHRPSWGPLPGGSHQLRPLWALRQHRPPVPKCSITFWSSPANSPLMSGPKGGIIGSPPLNYLRTHHPSLTSCQHGAKPQRPGILGQAGTPPMSGWKVLSMCLACPSAEAHIGKLRPIEGEGPPSTSCLQFAEPGSWWLGWSWAQAPGAFSQPPLFFGGPQRPLRRLCSPLFVATPHLVFVCSILCGSVWDNSHRAGSAPRGAGR